MKISVGAPEPVPLEGDFLCTAPDLSSPLWGILLCRTSDRDTLLCKINAGWKYAAAFLEKRAMIPQRPSKDQGNCSHDLIACTSLISTVMEWTYTSPTGEGTKLIIPILSSTVSACTEICLWEELMSQVKNWGLLVALEVYRFWIFAALSCKLQAFFFSLPIRMQQYAVKCIVFCLLRLLHWDSGIPIFLLKCGEIHGQPKLNKTSMAWVRIQFQLLFSESVSLVSWK